MAYKLKKKQSIISLVIKIQFFGEHEYNTWNQFPFMKSGVQGEGLKFHGYLLFEQSKNCVNSSLCTYGLSIEQRE
jgi:hypothetical protein